MRKYPPFCTFKWVVAALAGTAQNWAIGAAADPRSCRISSDIQRHRPIIR